MKNNYSVINVYKKSNTKSEVVTQLLYGDKFKKLKFKNSFIQIKNESDNYKGFIKRKKFSNDLKNTHKVYNLKATLYSESNHKSKIKKKLSFGSKIKVIKKIGNFYKFDHFWIEKKDLKEKNYKKKNIFQNVRKFNKVKYKWGGKCYKGIDCSALVQLFFNINNKFCPRDAKDQIKYFKKKISLKNIMKNDLIFWKGHVAIALSKHELIHAYGPLKKTVIMPIKKTIDRILKTANLKVIGIRRI